MKSRIRIPGLAVALLVSSCLCFAIGHRISSGKARLTAETGSAHEMVAISGKGTNGQETKRSRGPGKGSEMLDRRMNAILSNDDAANRLRSLLVLARETGADGFGPLLDAMSHSGLGRGAVEFDFLLNVWADDFPQSAMEWAGQDYALQIQILNRWIESNPSAAAEWARLHSQRGSANQLFLMSLGRLVGVDPSAAMQEVQKLSNPGGRRMAFQATLGALEKRGKEDVRKWLDALPSSDLRIEAVATLVAEKGPSFCPDRIYWLEIYPEASKRADLQGSWSFWFQQDEKAALEHFASATPPSMKGAALEGMASFCARYGDPARGLELMDANAQDVTSTAITAWVKATGKRDPALALSQASRIQDPGENGSIVTTILNRWIRSDRDAAESWLDTNSIPDSVREAMDKP